MQAEGSYGGRVIGVGRINGYEGAGVERSKAAEGILCFPACVSVSTGVRGIEGPPVSFYTDFSVHLCPTVSLLPFPVPRTLALVDLNV